MSQPGAGATSGHARRWWVWLAALAGLCLVIVVLAAQPAHAEEALGADVWKEEGRIPADRYALTMPIGFDPAHGEVVSDDVFERVKRIADLAMYTIAALFHDLGVMITRLGLWLLDLAFSFTVIDAIRVPVAELSATMQNTFVAGIGLDDFAVFLAVFYCGIQLLRRRTAHSLGELAASMLIAVAGATLVANPLDALDATALTVKSISVAMMDLAWEPPVSNCGPPDNCSPERRPSITEQGYEIPKNMSDQLYKSMIVEPYDIANWGEPLQGSCARKRDEFLRGDNHTDEDLFVKEMWAEGCREQVIFNTSMSFNRVGVALLTFVVRLVLLGFNAVLSASVMGGQFMLGQVAVVLPLFVVLATVPGTGRQIGLKGLNATAQAGAAVILAGFMLTILVTFQTALLGGDEPLLTRYTLVLVMVIMLWRYRGPLRDMINEILLHFTQRLKTHSPGNIAPNLLGDRELWENSIKKRLKENFVDSSYRGTRDTLGKVKRLRHRRGGGATDPSVGRGDPTVDDGPVRRRTPKKYVHDVKQNWQRFGQTWKRRGQAVMDGTKTTARVSGKGAQELARLSGQGFRGGLKLSRKGLVGTAGVVGAVRNVATLRETVGDAAGIAADSTVAGLRATRQGMKRARDAAHYAHVYGGILAGDAVRGAKKGRDAVEVRLIRASMAANDLGKDMAASHTYRASNPRSVLPGAAKRDAQRSAKHQARSRTKAKGRRE